jgi:hypothetical protein
MARTAPRAVVTASPEIGVGSLAWIWLATSLVWVVLVGCRSAEFAATRGLEV